MGKANLHKYRVKVFVYDHDERDEYEDPDMTVKSHLSGSDIKHLIKNYLSTLLGFEKMNPNNSAIQ